MKRRGLTLIELLVIVAILTILAAILLPVFSRTYDDNTHFMTCSSNQKQLSLAIGQYAQDYDGVLPRAEHGASSSKVVGGWVFYSRVAKSNGAIASFNVAKGTVFPYIKTRHVFTCPSDKVGLASGNSYALNGCITGKAVNHFKSPASMMMLSEEASNGTSTDDGYQSLQGDGFSERHHERSYVAFLDGHVKRYRVQDILSKKLQTGGAGRCP